LKHVFDFVEMQDKLLLSVTAAFQFGCKNFAYSYSLIQWRGGKQWDQESMNDFNLCHTYS